jgi:photosystem II stability/assembly factor-like uncharacterized protein
MLISLRKKSHGSELILMALQVLLAVIVVFVSTLAEAQSPTEPVLLSGDHLEWRSIGPYRGGRSISAIGSSKRPLEYYFGAAGGGLWKTADAGQSWNPVSDGFFQTSSVGAVAVAPSDPDVVYVGMGEAQLRGDIIQGDGVYKSVNGGETWEHLGLEQTLTISRIRVHPTNPDLAYIAALGDPYGPNPERGVYRTKDGGESWQNILFRDERTGAVDLAIDPNNPQILYAALWEVYRRPHMLSSGGEGSGLFKSDDGGDSWKELTRAPGMPEGVIGKIGVAPSPADPSRVYAIIEAKEGGVFRSNDGGTTWGRVNDERNLRQRAFYYTRLTPHPQDPDAVFVLNTGLYRSIDGGESYTSLGMPHGDHHDLWINPENPSHMISASDGGGSVSLNGGQSWTAQNFPTAQMYNVITTGHVPYHVCGAQQDYGGGICLPPSDGLFFGNPRPWYLVGGGESGYIAQSPINNNVFFAGRSMGIIWRTDLSTKQSRVVSPWPKYMMGNSAEDMEERFPWTYPIVFSPTDDTALYTASQHLFRSIDEGASWEKISSDLTRADDETLGPSGGPITLDQTGIETYGTVFTVAPSRHESTTIWTGSDDGLVHVTRDLGKSWADVTPSDLPDFTRISLIEASQHNAGTAYLAGNRYQLSDRAPYVFKTHDYGRTWVKITTGIRLTDFARVIREDPVRPGLLYLGTERGVYISFDDGGHWESLQMALPVASVQGLVIEGDDLVIGTHGRGFYVLDDIEVLRQYDPEIAARPLHLFRPSDVTRTVDPGVIIDYYLGYPAEVLTIEVLDSTGEIVRRFKGAVGDRSDSIQSEVLPFGSSSLRVSTDEGVHRVHWDLRYPDAIGFEGMILYWPVNPVLRGPLAPPGEYQIRVKGNGKSITHPVRILRDERLSNVTDQDLQDQFTLSQQVMAKLNEANQKVALIRMLKDTIMDRVSLIHDSDLVLDGESLVDGLTSVEGEIYQYRNQSRQDPLNFPIKLNNQLAGLLGVIQSADAAPTVQSYAVFDELSAQLNELLRSLSILITEELANFNTRLRKNGIEEISWDISLSW